MLSELSSFFYFLDIKVGFAFKSYFVGPELTFRCPKQSFPTLHHLE